MDRQLASVLVPGLRDAADEAVTADGWSALRLEATVDDGIHTVAVVDSFGPLRSLEGVRPAAAVCWSHEPATVVRSLAYERVGNATVERSAWVDAAVFATAEADETD